MGRLERSQVRRDDLSSWRSGTLASSYSQPVRSKMNALEVKVSALPSNVNQPYKPGTIVQDQIMVNQIWTNKAMRCLYTTKKHLPSYEPSLARLITIDPNDTVNPDQDIKPMFKYVMSMSWRDQCIKETMVNVFNPSGKLYGSCTMHRLRILCSTFRHSQLHHINSMVTWTFQQPLHAY